MTRIAHYVCSTHWDREWYEPFQGYRMRLVQVLDEVFEALARGDSLKSFFVDGQTIPIMDYLEVRPEKAELLRHLARERRLELGPWYVLPDEYLVSGESLIRNLQFGTKLARELGSVAPSRAGIVADEFGHVSQLPQIFSQLGMQMAFVWRGTHETDHHGHFHWQAPDGSVLPTFRFGLMGYSTYPIVVRRALERDEPFNFDDTVKRLVEHAQHESKRSELGPILLFDGGDHMEIDPNSNALIARANEELANHGIRITHSSLEAYITDVLKERTSNQKKFAGELRDSGRDREEIDWQCLLSGSLSSRVGLKQRNAACEDELCRWAEPFSTFASEELGLEYPVGYLRIAWKHLLENHPHDSICGCSIDAVHQDMMYRFDQSMQVSARLTTAAFKAIARASVPADCPEKAIVLAVFNGTAEEIDEPIDIEIPFPSDWPATFQEFLNYEVKYDFKLRGPDGAEIPYQLVSQQKDRQGFRRRKYKFPGRDARQVAGVTARLKVPACGYTTLVVEPPPKPNEPPTRYFGTMMKSHDTIENEHLRVRANVNGTISITCKSSGKTFDQLLTFEQRADIGDGWCFGPAVNDQVFTSATSTADVAVVADGIGKATLRIAVTINVPEAFDFATMTRSERLAPLRIVSEVTLRQGVERVEVLTTVHNTVMDHRLRVLLPTELRGDVYHADSAFDVIERPVALAKDNSVRRELDVDGRPQASWTAFSDGKQGLAVVSRGLFESGVLDTQQRPLFLTLLRSFRKAVFANDNLGGQVQGKPVFRYWIMPIAGELPVKELFHLGQRVNDPVRTVDVAPHERSLPQPAPSLPRARSFLRLEGRAVVTSVQREGARSVVRLFNPGESQEKITLRTSRNLTSARSVSLDGEDDSRTTARVTRGEVELLVAAKRIVTIVLE